MRLGTTGNQKQQPGTNRLMIMSARKTSQCTPGFFLQSPMYTLYCPRVTWSGQFAFDVLLPALNWAAIRRGNGQAALSPALSPSLSSPELSNRIVLCHLSSRAVKHHRYRLRLACMLSSCHRPLGTVICLLRLQDGLQSMTKTRQHIILTA